MGFSPKVLWGLWLTGTLLATGPAFAQETAAPSSQSSTDENSIWGQVKKKGRVAYLAEFLGMRTEALSGNGGPGREGGGTNLSLNHYFQFGWKTSENTRLGYTQLLIQTIDENPNNKEVTFFDPYFTLSHSNLWKNEKYQAKLTGYVRYYAPLSRGSSDAANKGYFNGNSELGPNDQGYGTVRFLLTPSKSFMDGKLTINGTMLTNIKLAKLSAQERFNRQVAFQARTGARGTPKSYREDLYFVFNPTISYTLSPKVDTYVEWGSYWRHSTNGKWTSVNDDDNGQYVATGVYWSPTKKIYVNPYVSYQLSAQDNLAPQYKGLAHMDIGLLAQYTFL